MDDDDEERVGGWDGVEGSVLVVQATVVVSMVVRGSGVEDDRELSSVHIASCSLSDSS